MEATEKKFYDQGWNACIDGEPYDPKATLDWRDGWKDCFGAGSADRVKI